MGEKKFFYSKIPFCTQVLVKYNFNADMDVNNE